MSGPPPAWQRLLLLAFPPDFRRRYGRDLLTVATERRLSSYGGSHLLIALDLLRNGIAARWDSRRIDRLRAVRFDSPRERAIPMSHLLRDVFYALRSLRKNPGFAAVAVLSLGLGIGANAAVFGVVDAALLRALPVDAPDELTAFHWVAGPGGSPDISINGWMLENEAGRGESSSFAFAQVEAFRAAAGELADFVAFADLYEVRMRVAGASELVGGQVVTGNYHPVLGVRPVAGRLLGPGDDRPMAEPVVVISHGLWTRRFGADPTAVGSEIGINGELFTVVGVTPPGFHGALQVGARPDLTLPLAQTMRVRGGADRLARQDLFWLHVVARRAPGVTATALQARLEPIFQAAVEEGVGGVPADVMPSLVLVDGSRGMTERRSLIDEGLVNLVWVVALVLVIACTNLANLLLARATTRRREIAVRLSLGAARGRLVRQLLTESLVLAGLGSAVGLLLAHYGRGLFVGLASAGDGLPLDVRLDGRVLVYTAVVTVVTALVFGLVPALRATRTDLTPALRRVDVAAAGSGRASLTARALLTVQVGLSILLLVVAGLFVRNLQGLVASAENFDPENVLVFSVRPGLNQYGDAQLLGFYDEALARIRTTPGVVAATVTNHSPVSGTVTSRTVAVDGHEQAADEGVVAYMSLVDPGFFETFSIPLLAGRTLADEDMGTAEDGPGVVVVNEEFARRFFPDRDPLGGTVRWESGDVESRYEIVGVVADVAYQTLDDRTWPVIHVPYTRSVGSLDRMTFAVRTPADPLGATPAMAAIVRDLDPDLPVIDARTLTQQRDHTLRTERHFARIAGLAGGLAMLLACVGLYGLLSYSVARRRREIGVRMALGAGSRDVLRLVRREMRPVFAGVALGLVVSFWATRALASQLHEIGTRDPYALTGAVVALLSVALVAAWLPARRAAATDPVRVLREE